MLKPFTAMYLHLLCIFNVILSLVLLVSAQQSRVGYQPGEVGLKKKIEAQIHSAHYLAA